MRLWWASLGAVLAAGAAGAEPAALPSAVAAQIAPQAGEAGLLLSCAAGEDGYRTLWLTLAPGRAAAREMPFVASPQKEGFRYLGVAAAPERSLDFKEEDGSEHSFSISLKGVWAGRDPAAARAALEKTLADESAAAFEKLQALRQAGQTEELESLWRRESIRFVGDGVLSLHHHVGSYVYGTAHPNHGEFWGTYPFTAAKPPARNVKPMALTDILPGADLKAIAAAQTKAARAGQFLDSPSDDPADAELLAADFAEVAIEPKAGGFVLAQREGRTRVLALAPVEASYAASGDYELLAAADAGPAPKSAAPYNEFKLSWASVRQAWPNVQDAFLAPGDRALAVLAGGTVTLYEGAGGARLWRGAFPCDRVVAANWATGKAVARWTAEFDRLR
ncbi:MAG TPA: hypothetical protein VEH84_12135 [Alphaproteobacteria bacterium]|nr:hypothetical protein [Alphaproteobacteria bacterium]